MLVDSICIFKNNLIIWLNALQDYGSLYMEDYEDYQLLFCHGGKVYSWAKPINLYALEKKVVLTMWCKHQQQITEFNNYLAFIHHLHMQITKETLAN